MQHLLFLNDRIEQKQIACYIHIPFCIKKCLYCDFYSITNLAQKNFFLSALCKEIDNYSKLYSEKVILSSIFIGGGTPSILPNKDIQTIFNKLKNRFVVDKDAEVTIEVNPGTALKNKLNKYFELGINRISIGVQSFNNKDLTFLSRIHNSKQAIKTINDAYEIGFDNINIDLIFNLPEQTKEKWLDNLSIAVDLPINHISTYALIVEKNTPLYKLVKKREVKITEPDYDAELYSAGIKFLRQNKFLQYEVSNFAREGYECKHNLAYWTYKNYLGFGPAAHSFFNGYRWNNFRNVEKYSNAINKNDSAIEKLEKLSDKQKLEEFVMLSLRSKGLDLFKVKIISDKWENENKNYINQLIENEYLKKMKNILRLTDRGYAVCDEILLKFNYF